MKHGKDDEAPTPHGSDRAQGDDATLIMHPRPEAPVAPDAEGKSWPTMPILVAAAPYGASQPLRSGMSSAPALGAPPHPNVYPAPPAGPSAYSAGPYAPHPSMPPGLPVAGASNRVVVPAAPKLPTRAAEAPFPAWFLPYVIGGIVLMLLGAFVLWNQARAVGHL